MKLSVYLPNPIASKPSLDAEQRHASKNAIVREALEEWLAHHLPSVKLASILF
jgi:hypothetical protein